MQINSRYSVTILILLLIAAGATLLLLSPKSVDSATRQTAAPDAPEDNQWAENDRHNTITMNAGRSQITGEKSAQRITPETGHQPAATSLSKYTPPADRRDFAKRFPAVDPRVETITAPEDNETVAGRLEALRSLQNERGDPLDAADMKLLADLLADASEDDTLRHETALFLRDEKYKGITDVLLYILESPAEQERFRAFCVQHLSQIAVDSPDEMMERIGSVLREALEDRHIAVRREAVLALVRAGDPAGSETAEAWLNDPSAANLHDLAIRCMRETNRRDMTEQIRAFLESPDEAARIAAIVTLAEWNDTASRPAFELAAASDNQRLQAAGQLALQQISK